MQFRTDKAGIVHGSIGAVGFETGQIKENLEALVGDLKKAKPASAKGVYLKKMTLSTTMGPGIVSTKLLWKLKVIRSDFGGSTVASNSGCRQKP